MVAATSAVVPGDRRRFLVLPAALVAYEWLHSHGPFGGVPLSLLAMTQAQTPLLAIARLGGVLLRRRRGVHARRGVVPGVDERVGDAGPWRSWRRSWRSPSRARRGRWASRWETVTIAAVQGGGPQGTRYAEGEEAEVFRRHLEATADDPR